MKTMLDKNIQKNREALIRHFYSLPEPDRNKNSSYYYVSIRTCLCAKGETMKKFVGMKVLSDGRGMIVADWNYSNPCTVPTEINSFINITEKQWCEMENRYEGYGYKRHSFSQIADWLQTLPGWPRVLL